MVPGAAVTAEEKPASAPADSRRAQVRALYETHRAEVWGFLVRFLRDRALAEDVLQEAFLRAFATLDRFDGSRPFRPWLFEIARNAAIDAQRRRRKTGELPPEAGEPALPDEAAEKAQRGEAVAETRGVLAKLPDETRALLVQRHGLGMTQEELAESFQCTERTIRNRLRTAADQFARELLAQRAKRNPGNPDADVERGGRS